MNSVTKAFNKFLELAIEDITLINDPYNRANARISIMRALAETGGVEVDFIGKMGEPNSTPREQLDNQPNPPASTASNTNSNEPTTHKIAGAEPGVNTAGLACGSEDLPVRPTVVETPNPANTQNTTPAPAEENKKEQRPFLSPDDLGDTWNESIMKKLQPEIRETGMIVKSNPGLVNPTFFSQIAIKVTNGLVTKMTSPTDIPPKFYRVFLSQLKVDVQAAGGNLPHVA